MSADHAMISNAPWLTVSPHGPFHRYYPKSHPKLAGVLRVLVPEFEPKEPDFRIATYFDSCAKSASHALTKIIAGYKRIKIGPAVAEF